MLARSFVLADCDLFKVHLFYFEFAISFCKFTHFQGHFLAAVSPSIMCRGKKLSGQNYRVCRLFLWIVHNFMIFNSLSKSFCFKCCQSSEFSLHLIPTKINITHPHQIIFTFLSRSSVKLFIEVAHDKKSKKKFPLHKSSLWVSGFFFRAEEPFRLRAKNISRKSLTKMFNKLLSYATLIIFSIKSSHGDVLVYTTPNNQVIFLFV